MSARQPDKALRRAVADLAGASPDDIEAVLAGLDPPQRKAVEALLDEYRGAPAPPPTPSAPPMREAIIVQGLSPWLAARLERNAQSGVGRPGALGAMSEAEARDAGLAYAMTQTAFEALRSCAAELDPAGAAPAPVTAARRGFLRKGPRR